MRRFLIAVLLLPFFIPSFVQAETDAERRARLQAELQVVERQILVQQRLVEDKQIERRSLERDVSIIDGEIKAAQLGIQARNIAIAQLGDQIEERAEIIEILDERMKRQQQSLADLIRKSNALDDYTMVEVLLSKNKLSEFFSEFAKFDAIKKSLNDSMATLHQIRLSTANEQDQLTDKQMTEAEMRRVQEMQREEINSRKAQKDQILKETKGQEEVYQQLLNAQQETAAELRNALFQLLGGGGGIPLPEAVRLANYAGSHTGVSPALILGILEQETNLGSHLGSCVYNDVRGGRPVMHPDRDAPVFLAVASILGFNASTQQVSCPLIQGGSPVGWGGAMGPSQFIPSTWAIYGGIVNNGNGWVYSQAQDRIRAANGTGGPSNPFNNQDAFIATALLLRDNGADGTYAGDRLAALRYYAGWGGASNPANAFYGDGVMQRKAKFEGQIKVLGAG